MTRGSRELMKHSWFESEAWRASPRLMTSPPRCHTPRPVTITVHDTTRRVFLFSRSGIIYLPTSGAVVLRSS